MTYAIAKFGSQQIKLVEGETIKIMGHVEKPSFEVLFFTDGKNSFTDKADLKEVKVSTSVVAQARGRKLIVGRFKSKSRYDKTRGYRDTFTKLLISGISFKGEAISSPKEEVKKAPKKRTATKTATKAPVKKVATRKKLEVNN